MNLIKQEYKINVTSNGKYSILRSRKVKSFIGINKVILRDVETTWEEELLTGIDGIKHEFNTSHEYVLGSTQLYWNGIRQSKGVDYLEKGGTAIELNFVPSNIGYNDNLFIRYKNGN